MEFIPNFRFIHFIGLCALVRYLSGVNDPVSPLPGVSTPASENPLNYTRVILKASFQYYQKADDRMDKRSPKINAHKNFE